MKLLPTGTTQALQQVAIFAVGSPGVLSGSVVHLVGFGGLKIELIFRSLMLFPSSPIIFLDFSPRRPSYQMSAFSIFSKSRAFTNNPSAIVYPSEITTHCFPSQDGVPAAGAG